MYVIIDHYHYCYLYGSDLQHCLWLLQSIYLIQHLCYELNSNPLEYAVHIRILSRLHIKHIISGLYTKVCKSIPIHIRVSQTLSRANYALSSMGQALPPLPPLSLILTHSILDKPSLFLLTFNLGCLLQLSHCLECYSSKYPIARPNTSSVTLFRCQLEIRQNYNFHYSRLNFIYFAQPRIIV